MSSPSPQVLHALTCEVLAASRRVLIVLAGINGAGKSSLYHEYIEALAGTAHPALPFINADMIARALPQSGDATADTLRAANLAEQERQRLLATGESFCMETVFSDRSGHKLEFLKSARRRGYTVVLIFVGLASAELAILRVAQRVLAGGHPVPADTIRERYPRTLGNFARALAFVDLALVYDNSDADLPFQPVSAWRKGRQILRDGNLPQWYRDVLFLKQTTDPLPPMQLQPRGTRQTP